MPATSAASAPASASTSQTCAAVPAPPDATTGTAHRVGDRAREREVVARARAVAVDAGEQDLARAAAHALRRPLHRVERRRLAAALHVHAPRRSPSRFASMLATTHCDAEALGRTR